MEHLTMATSLENQYWLVSLGVYKNDTPKGLVGVVRPSVCGATNIVGLNLCTSTLGFARSLGLQLPDGQRREWIKPIMFSGGIGSMEAKHVGKEPPEPGKSHHPSASSQLPLQHRVATAGNWLLFLLLTTGCQGRTVFC